jgi:serine/threonine protein kinase
VKRLPPYSESHQGAAAAHEALIREIQLASKFRCERLVTVYGACTDRDHPCLVMELMEGGSLFQRIYDRRRRRMSYVEILQLANDVAVRE